MSDHTVIIMGAGAIRAASGTKPIAKRPPLDRDFFEIASKVSPELHQKVVGQVKSLVGSYSSHVLKSLEDTTTLLYLKAVDSTRNSAAHLAFLNQLELLARVLADTTNDLPTGPASLLYRVILRELSGLDSPEDLTIITFNYDLMIERALDEIQSRHADGLFMFPGCYRLPPDTSMTDVAGAPTFTAAGVDQGGVAVLKLHGSLNWGSTHTSQQPTPGPLFRSGRQLHILNSKRIESALSWNRGRRRVYVKPIILPPVTGKRGLLHRSLTDVWARAASALSRASRLVIFGYSCPPLDFEAKMLLGEMVQPTVTTDLTVVDPNPAIASRFVPLCGVTDARIFTCAKALLSNTPQA